MFAYGRVSNPRRDRAILLAALGAAVGVAWLALLVWAASPYGRFLSHDAGGGALAVEAGRHDIDGVVEALLAEAAR